jgi:ferredoxin--NADP+ reductase
MIMASWIDGVVVDNRQWSDRLFSLRIDAALGEFNAGQFVRVALDIDGEQVARPYSLVNAPDEDALEIYFDVVPDGLLSKKLATLKKGDVIKVADNPSGFLTISEVPDVENLWMVATGTGIGPFLSCLKTDEPWRRFKHIVLAHSVRSSEDLTYTDTICRLQEEHPEQLKFVSLVTRENVEGSINARVTSAIESGDLEKYTNVMLDADNSHIMLCGNSGMIKGVTELLETRGMRKHKRREPGHIATEKYH